MGLRNTVNFGCCYCRAVEGPKLDNLHVRKIDRHQKTEGHTNTRCTERKSVLYHYRSGAPPMRASTQVSGHERARATTTRHAARNAAGMPEPRDTALTSGGDRLVLAAEHGLVPAIEELLAQGVQVNYRNHVFATALYCAVFHNHLPVVTSLLSHGADPNLARTGSFTPLHVASYRGDHVECARMLVDAGADTAVQDEMGKTALEHARLYRRPGVVAVLEEAENRPRPAA